MRRADSHPAMAPLRLGISACLLGQAVRYDGGHKRDPFLAETLGRFVEWVPVCPEVELAAGMTRARLAAFHAAHERLLLANHPAACRRLGALVANAGKRPLRAVVADYGAGFMEALRTQAPPSTRRRAPRRPAPPAPRRSP